MHMDTGYKYNKMDTFFKIWETVGNGMLIKKKDYYYIYIQLFYLFSYLIISQI
jgi:hypothetical protein